MDPMDREKTTFYSMSGLFEFQVMPFGLCYAPSTFKRLMDKVFYGSNHQVCLIYLDDTIVKNATFESHVKNLGLVFNRLRAAGLKLAPKKCNLFKTEVMFLGHVVSIKGISTDPSKIQAVTDWLVLTKCQRAKKFCRIVFLL